MALPAPVSAIPEQRRNGGSISTVGNGTTPAVQSSLRVADHMSGRVQGMQASATLLTVAQLLARSRISCAVIFEGERPVGIISERDLVRLVTEDPAGWSQRIAGDVMTRPLHAISPETSVVDASGVLAQHRIRRLPVISSTDGALHGIVTQTDLLRASHHRLEEYAADLERLVADRTADLRASEQRRNDLVDLTVHDMKNWIQAAEGSLDLATEDPAEGMRLLPLLRHTTGRIRNLVYALLDVNRLESGWMPVRFTDVPWLALSDPLVAETSVMARAKGLTITRSGDAHVIIRCDPDLIERVLLNLLDNAVNAAPAGTPIDLHVEWTASGFLVRIGNRGPVITRDILTTLFRKYQRSVSDAPLARFGGWGLGLTFCRLAVERHGGTIRAISPYVDGEGAAFEFTIPRRPEDATVTFPRDGIAPADGGMGTSPR
jgi:signal transduction histidine kinase